MRTTKKILIILWMTLSASCSFSPPKIDPQKVADISFKFDRCRLRCFDIIGLKSVDDKLCGENFKSGNFRIKECDLLIGVYTEDFATEIKPWMTRTRNWCGIK